MRAEDRGVFVTANGINKSLRQAIIDGDIGSTVGGTGITEIFNHVISVNGNAPSLTGLSYFLAPKALTINFVRLQVFTKNGISTGNLVVNVKKNTTPDEVGMTSIFSAQPTINFGTDPDYTFNAGTLATSAVSIGDYLRLDVTSIPAGWVGEFQFAIYGG